MTKTIASITMCGLLMCTPAAHADLILIDSGTISTVASNNDQGRVASNTLDGDLGLSGATSSMWMASSGGTYEGISNQWIKYDLGAVYELAAIKIWNYNEYNWTERGIKYLHVQYAGTAAQYAVNNFTTIVADVLVPRGKSASQTADDYALVTLPTNFSTQYIRLDVVEGWSLSTQLSNRWKAGLAEVQFYVPEPTSLALLGLGVVGLLARRRTARS